MPSLILRPAHAADLPAICQLADEINAIHHAHQPDVFLPPTGDDSHAPWWLARMTARDGIMLLALHADALIGFVTADASIPDSLPPFVVARRECRIGTIVVTEAWRGQGVGRQLLAAVESWAQGMGAVGLRLQVFEFNTGAIRLYEGEGFVTPSRFMLKPLASAA